MIDKKFQTISVYVVASSEKDHAILDLRVFTHTKHSKKGYKRPPKKNLFRKNVMYSDNIQKDSDLRFRTICQRQNNHPITL